MKTRVDRARELEEMTTTEQGREKIVTLWKKYEDMDPGHWRPAAGWDFTALIQNILKHEYHRV